MELTGAFWGSDVRGKLQHLQAGGEMGNGCSFNRPPIGRECQAAFEENEAGGVSNV